MWGAIFGIQGRLDREPRSESRGEVVGTNQAVKAKIRQGAPIVEYDPLVKIDWEARTAKLTAPGDQAEKELQRLKKSLAAKGVRLTTRQQDLKGKTAF